MNIRTHSTRAARVLLTALSAGLALAATTSLGTGATVVGASANASPPYTFNFPGTPATPMPWNPPNWDVQVHSRDLGTWYTLEPMLAQHGPQCQAPPAGHAVSSYADAVFLCNNHVMTAIKAAGYGEIVLTPDHMVDFSGGQASISFNLSTLRTSLRDWVDFWVSPYDENVVLPYRGHQPDLQGPPRDAVQVEMKGGGSNGQGSYFVVRIWRNFAGTYLPYKHFDITNFEAASGVTRTRFELDISRTHVRFGMPSFNAWWVDTNIADLGWSSGIVQLVHHSYNPTKPDGCGGAVLPCVADTWHWSNFAISSAIPFTMIRATQPYADVKTPTMTFPRPAPVGAFLRFAGSGNTSHIQVSYNNGASWQVAAHPNQVYFDSNRTTSNYWMAIPAGSTSVRFRGSSQWIVRGVAVWSRTVLPGTLTASASQTTTIAPTVPMTHAPAAPKVPVTRAPAAPKAVVEQTPLTRLSGAMTSFVARSPISAAGLAAIVVLGLLLMAYQLIIRPRLR